MTTVTVNMRGVGLGKPVEVLARCGHYLVPERQCAEEPNPPTAWCNEDDDWAYFDGLSWEGERLVIGAGELEASNG